MFKFCDACGYHNNIIREVYGEGNLIAPIMVIGEAPGKDENKTGRPFVGNSGKLLREVLNPILSHCYITNVVKCFPFGTPTQDAINTCMNIHLVNQVKFIRPEAIILVGKIAERNFPRNISKATIYSIYHPSYQLHGGMTKEKYKEHVATVLAPLFEKYSMQVPIFN
jgi:DNA polymerase